MIEWDDDADIHIYRKDQDKIMNLKNEFEKYGIKIEKNWKLIKIYFNNDKYPFIDMFLVDKDKYNHLTKRCMTDYTICKEVNAKWWKKFYDFPFEWINQRVKLKFGNLYLWAPKQYLKLLYFWYGNNCLKECYSNNYDHITGKYITPKIIQCKLPKPQIIHENNT